MLLWERFPIPLTREQENRDRLERLHQARDRYYSRTHSLDAVNSASPILYREPRTAFQEGGLPTGPAGTWREVGEASKKTSPLARRSALHD